MLAGWRYEEIKKTIESLDATDKERWKIILGELSDPFQKDKRLVRAKLGSYPEKYFEPKLKEVEKFIDEVSAK